jgi:hypothetical protein
LTVLKTKDISSSLTKKGFQIKENDHTYIILYINVKKTYIRNKISHGKRDIDDYLIKLMATQLKLDKNQFLKLVDCSISQERYVNILMDAGLKFT